MQRVRVLEHDVDQGVAGLVPGGELLILIGHGHAAAFAAPTNLVAGLFQFGHADGLLAGAGGEQRGFIQ